MDQRGRDKMKWIIEKQTNKAPEIAEGRGEGGRWGRARFHNRHWQQSPFPWHRTDVNFEYIFIYLFCLHLNLSYHFINAQRTRFCTATYPFGCCRPIVITAAIPVLFWYCRAIFTCVRTRGAFDHIAFTIFTPNTVRCMRTQQKKKKNEIPSPIKNRAHIYFISFHFIIS